MYYPLPEYSPPTEFFCVMRECFSDEQLDQIIGLVERQEFFQKTRGNQGGAERDGTIGDGRVDESVRKSKVTFLEPNPETEWLFGHLAHLINKANYDKFGMQINFLETIQFTKYEDTGGHYDWHIDSHQGEIRPHHRKLSMTLMLTNPEDYEGGELLLNNDGNQEKPAVLKPRRGELVVFYSHLPHKVAPVTKGERLSLVAWVLGPKMC